MRVGPGIRDMGGRGHGEARGGGRGEMVPGHGYGEPGASMGTPKLVPRSSLSRGLGALRPSEAAAERTQKGQPPL